MDHKPLRLPTLLTEREVSDVFGVSVDTIRRLRRAGKIAHTRIGGRIRYTEQHLLAYLERETQACADPRENASARSGGTGSADDPTAPPGAEPGTMDPLDRQNAHRLAQRIFGTRS